MFRFGRRQERATAPASPLPDDARRLHLRFVGQVQGVGFRYFVLRAAAALGIGGWVRNCCDGSVEMYLHGEQAAVEQLLQKIRAGTPMFCATSSRRSLFLAISHASSTSKWCLSCSANCFPMPLLAPVITAIFMGLYRLTIANFRRRACLPAKGHCRRYFRDLRSAFGLRRTKSFRRLWGHRPRYFRCRRKRQAKRVCPTRKF